MIPSKKHNYSLAQFHDYSYASVRLYLFYYPNSIDTLKQWMLLTF